MKRLTSFVFFLCVCAVPSFATSLERQTSVIESALNECASFVTAADFGLLENSWVEISSRQFRTIDERVFAHKEVPLVLEAMVARLDEKTISEQKLPVSPFTSSDCVLRSVDAKDPTMRYRLRPLELPATWKEFENIKGELLQDATTRWLQSKSASLSRLGPEGDSGDAGFIDCQKTNPEFTLISSGDEENPPHWSTWRVEVIVLLPGQAKKSCNPGVQ